MSSTYNPEYESNHNLHHIEDEKKSEIQNDSSPYTAPSVECDQVNTMQIPLSSSQSLSVSPHHYNPSSSISTSTSRSTASTSTIGTSSTLPTSMATSPSRLITNNMKISNRMTRKPNGHNHQYKKQNMSRLERIIHITPTCFLKPKCFFIAWNAVPTLVFGGWPEPIDTMKNELSQSCTVCKEMFGTKFPKITLGCVKDGIEITPKLLAKIRRLAQQQMVTKDYVLAIDALSVVLWENRCQESIIYEKIIPLKKNHKFLGSPRPLLLNLEDQDDAPYLRSANRTSHYRSRVIGSSIVHRLIHIPKFITDFQEKLPKDIFDTFSKESLHVSIRALC